MTEVAHPAPVPSVKARPIINDQLIPASRINRPAFEPSKHLSYVEAPKTLSLDDLELSPPNAISPVAVSEPFPLFSEEAMRIMRSEIFTNEVWENCMWSTEFAGCQLRQHAPKYAKFMYDAWTHPRTLDIISSIAGIELEPILPHVEIGNINVSIQDPNKDPADAENVTVTKWHNDSYPFVCVVMMSDASKMVGGETALLNGKGEVMKVRGPQMGCGVILQGRCITHQALAAVGGTERITMITSFKPRDPFVMDDSVLTSIRPITEHSELYFQWTEYRIEVLQERLRTMMKEMEKQHRAGRKTDKERIKRFLKQQEQWLKITNDEII